MELKICVVYDCLFPYTVGGAERWYRNLSERLAGDGHAVTYLTMRQWEHGSWPDLQGVTVHAVGPRIALYTEGGRRKIYQSVIFGLGVYWHLLRHGRRYDVVHTASFPYFSLLAAGLLQPIYRYRLVVDWHEVWTHSYWREYLGAVGGTVGWLIQRLCAKLPQQAFCFSQLHAARLQQEGLRGTVTVLEGEYAGSLDSPDLQPAGSTVVFAGRHIPEKRVPLLVEAMRIVHERSPEVCCEIYGDGPQRELVLDLIRRYGLEDVVDAPGFVDSERIERAFARAACMVLPSSREGYGMVVVESSYRGTPSIVVAGPDNAATELVADGVNGLVVNSPDPAALADAILQVHTAGNTLRHATHEWFKTNARRLSIESSLETVLQAYR